MELSTRAEMTFKGDGADRIREAIANDIANTQHLAMLVRRSDDFELMFEPNLSVCVFRYLSSDPGLRSDDTFLDRFNAEMAKAIEADGRVFPAATTLDGRTGLRACIVNHRTEEHSVEYLLEVVREVRRAVETKLGVEYTSQRQLEAAIAARGVKEAPTGLARDGVLDLAVIPEDIRVAFYGALFAVAASDGAMAKAQVPLSAMYFSGQALEFQELPHKIWTERSAGLPAEAKARSCRNTPSIERLLNAGIGRQNGAARRGAILWGSS